MFLKLTFLEGKALKELFHEYPPKVVYVASGRIKCAMNGNFEQGGRRTDVTIITSRLSAICTRKSSPTSKSIASDMLTEARQSLMTAITHGSMIVAKTG